MKIYMPQRCDICTERDRVRKRDREGGKGREAWSVIPDDGRTAGGECVADVIGRLAGALRCCFLLLLLDFSENGRWCTMGVAASTSSKTKIIFSYLRSTGNSSLRTQKLWSNMMFMRSCHEKRQHNRRKAEEGQHDMKTMEASTAWRKMKSSYWHVDKRKTYNKWILSHRCEAVRFVKIPFVI